MTAEPRDVESIRADIARVPRPGEQLPDRSLHGWIGVACRLRDDAEALLDCLAAADRENAELRGEVERLRDLVARQLGDCIGCSPQAGPEETCPRDGRTYAEWVEIASMVIGRQHANEAERDDLRAQLAAAQAQLAEAPSLWSCPDCAFTFDAGHTDADGGYSCPLCGEIAAEARLEAVRARAVAIMSSWNPGDPAYRAAQELYVLALSAAPQPEPDANLPYSGADVESSLGDDLVSPAGVRRAYAERFAPEPPASDETDREV